MLISATASAMRLAPLTTAAAPTVRMASPVMQMEGFREGGGYREDLGFGGSFEDTRGMYRGPGSYGGYGYGGPAYRRGYPQGPAGNANGFMRSPGDMRNYGGNARNRGMARREGMYGGGYPYDGADVPAAPPTADYNSYNPNPNFGAAPPQRYDRPSSAPPQRYGATYPRGDPRRPLTPPDAYGRRDTYGQPRMDRYGRGGAYGPPPPPAYRPLRAVRGAYPPQAYPPQQGRMSERLGLVRPEPDEYY